MPLIGPRRKYVTETEVYVFGRYNLEASGHRRRLWRKNRAQRRWLKREARNRRRYRGCTGIDPTKPVEWSRTFATYEP